jgi:hypothetical protein
MPRFDSTEPLKQLRDVAAALGWRGLVIVLFVAALCGCSDDGLPVMADVEDEPAAMLLDRLVVTVDGQPVDPASVSLDGNPDELRAGDLMMIDSLVLTLGTENEYHFHTTPSEDGRLWLESADGTRRLVGVSVRQRYRDGQTVIEDPLTKLTPGEVRGLWGIYLEHWSDAIGDRLKDIDPVRACVCISDGAAVRPGQSLPRLPVPLRCLVVDSRSSDGLKRFDAISRLPDLRYLRVRLISHSTVDLSVLKNAPRLRRLEMSGVRLRNSRQLARLSNLRVLDLGYCQGIGDVAFVRQLPRLRHLSVRRTDVEDLSPLVGHPALEQVDADRSPVRRLPAEPASQMRILRVMSTRLSDDQVSSFRLANPDCLVWHRWTTAFQQAVDRADHLRVRTGGTCHRDPDQEECLFETSDTASIQALVAGLEIDEAQSNFHCMCCGDPSLEFYCGQQLLATLGHHHGRSLRWPGGWPSDALLTESSAAFLRAWLGERGVLGPNREHEAELERQRAWERRVAAVGEAVPLPLRQALTRGTEPFGAALKKELPDKAEQVTVLLRILGVSNGSWTTLDSLDHTAEQLLRGFARDELTGAVQRALSGDDRRLRRGAARFWVAFRSPIKDWCPPDPGPYYAAVLDVQRQSRYRDTRMRGLQNLVSWHGELPPGRADELLQAGLRDPDPQVRRQAMLSAGEMRHQASKEMLLQILRGKPPDVQSLPEVPQDETDDVPQAFERVGGDSSDADLAALALGYLGATEAKDLLAGWQPLTPMAEVALALLGEPERLRKEHFQTPDANQTLQLAAVAAVIRNRGRAGLGYAVHYRQATHWWEEETVARRLSTMLRAEKAPGAEALDDYRDLTQLQQWWDRYGKKFLDGQPVPANR